MGFDLGCGFEFGWDSRRDIGPGEGDEDCDWGFDSGVDGCGGVDRDYNCG